MRFLTFRKTCVYCLVQILIFSPLKPVYADTLTDNAPALPSTTVSTQDQEALQLQLEATAATQAQSIQESINVLKSAIDKDNASIAQHQKAIAALDAEQQKLAAVQKKNMEDLGTYIKNMYLNGDDTFLTYVSWLIHSKSFDDLINRYSYVDTILDTYRDLKAKIAENSSLITQKRSSEQSETQKLATEIKSEQQLIAGLNAALTKQTEIIESLNGDSLFQSQSRGQNDTTERLIEAEKLQAQLATQAKYQQLLASELASDKLQGSLNTPAKLNGQVSQLLSFASTFLGVPYTWGGTYPQFDCSSYVQYVYGHFGIKLARVTWDQYTEGQSVEKNQLQTGDLVFFTTYQAGPSHVGIYIGNDIMINCSNSGVSYANMNSDYWSSRYYGARRVIAQ